MPPIKSEAMAKDTSDDFFMVANAPYNGHAMSARPKRVKQARPRSLETHLERRFNAARPAAMVENRRVWTSNEAQAAVWWVKKAGGPRGQRRGRGKVQRARRGVLCQAKEQAEKVSEKKSTPAGRTGSVSQSQRVQEDGADRWDSPGDFPSQVVPTRT